MTVVAELGYPRDLLERNRVNLVITRPGADRFEIVTRQLRMKGFEPSPPEERLTIVPPNDQRVALQTLLGSVSDCESSVPMSATLDVTYRWGDDDRVHSGSIAVSDATVLDEIWKVRCLEATLAEDFQLEFVDVDIDLEQEEMYATLRLSRITNPEPLTIETVSGTVLVGVEVLVPAEERTLPTSSDRLDLPLKFVVNRCDSHAVAETTRRYGVDLWVLTTAGDTLRITVDIASISDDLAALVAHCQERTGSS